MASSNPFLCVLFAPDIVATISSFQDGLCLDMLSLLSLQDVRYKAKWMQDETASVDYFQRIMPEIIQPRLSSWLDTWGVDRLPKLFACLPFVRYIVIQYATWSGNLSLLQSDHHTFGRHPEHGLALLTLAIEKNDLPVLEFLCDCGYTNMGSPRELYQRAIKQHNLPIVRFLDTRQWAPEQFWDPLSEAAGCGSIELVRYFLAQTPQTHNPTPLYNAAAQGHYATTIALLDLGFDASNLSLDAAASGGNLQLVQHLHDLGGYDCTTSAMDSAAEGGHLDVVHWLHTHREEGCTHMAFVYAVAYGHLDVLQFLHKEYLDSIDPSRMVDAARSAVKNGHGHVVRYLFEHKLCAWSPLIMDHIASFGQLELAQWLKQNQTKLGIQMSSRGACTTAAIARASANGHLAMLDWLHHNCQIVGRSQGPVFSAIEHGHIYVVQWLMVHGYVDGVDSCTVAKATGQGPTVKCPQDYFVDPDYRLLRHVIRTATNGHMKMVQWFLQSNTHVCACDVLRYGQDSFKWDPIARVLEKKASKCEKQHSE
ncbi:Aste57867_25376 [Aphanomyces stellatus]|uniref:Aste57867_25376 protein n=1 Tax=Aphanomyces stellatus TaxID=120398 RepID=A0A485LUC2_9STRA|nr:hypothetical protein As57867_025297 [Aphanomyces stellatus]VFU02001.1 Aste57867_25376 [Aphanomyces stellatus]